jgi:hypothetical protein
MGLFGLGDGEIKLQIKNINVAVGQPVEGTVLLKLNEDIKARGISVILYAEKTETTNTPQGQTLKKNTNIYDKTIQLDTEKTYEKSKSPYEYTFSFVIPQIGMFSGIVRWYIKAELKHETVLSFPMAAMEEINIISQPQPQASTPQK